MPTCHRSRTCGTRFAARLRLSFHVQVLRLLRSRGFLSGGPDQRFVWRADDQRRLPTPIWFNEFTAGGGGYYGTPGRSRMYAYLGIMMGAQGFSPGLSTVTRGEEQALFGLVDHDGTLRGRWMSSHVSHRNSNSFQIWIPPLYTSRSSHCLFIRFLHRLSSKRSLQHNAAILQAFLHGAGARGL
jgi:hypothetical protein